MRNINTELRTSYYNFIAGNVIIDTVTIPYYYQQVPLQRPSTNPDNFILLNSIYQTGYNDDRYNYTNTAVQFMICTRAFQNNSGLIADETAGQMFAIVYPTSGAQIVQIVNGQVIDTTLQTDLLQTGLDDGEKKVLNRIITFVHKIKHDRGSVPVDTGLIYYGVQDDNSDPIDLSNSLNANPNNPISIDYGVQPLLEFYWLAVPFGFMAKQQWEDLNAVGSNTGNMGNATDLYEIRVMQIGSVNYVLYMTYYLTGFNGVTSQVRYF